MTNLFACVNLLKVHSTPFYQLFVLLIYVHLFRELKIHSYNVWLLSPTNMKPKHNIHMQSLHNKKNINDLPDENL